MKYDFVLFSSANVGLQFFKQLVADKFYKRINIKAVVVCQDKRNPYFIEGVSDAVKLYAQKNNIEVLMHPDELDTSVSYDLGLSLSNFHILKDRHIDLFKNGIINFHGAPVLWYAGSATPVYHILTKDTSEWGYTYHYIDEGIDSGDIIKQVIYSLPPGLNSKEIDASVMVEAKKEFPFFIQELLENNLDLTNKCIRQTHTNPKIVRRKELGEYNSFDMNIESDSLERVLRAFDWPAIVEHPSILVNNQKVRVVPERTYQELLAIFRRFSNTDKIKYED